MTFFLNIESVEAETKSEKIDMLGEKLKKEYENTPYKVAQIIQFGARFAEFMKSNDIKPSDVVKSAKMNDSYASELTKGLNFYELSKANKEETLN